MGGVARVWRPASWAGPSPSRKPVNCWSEASLTPGKISLQETKGDGIKREWPGKKRRRGLVSKGDGSLRSRLGVLSVGVSTRLAGETGLEVNSQSRLYTALDRKSHYFLLLLLLCRKIMRWYRGGEGGGGMKDEEEGKGS